MRIDYLKTTLILILLVSSQFMAVQAQNEDNSRYSVEREYNTLSEQWTEIRYTTFVYSGYSEYYPFEISFRSLGELPPDLQEYNNYTGPVFIDHYILSSNLSTFDNIDRERDNDELIGQEGLDLTFKLDTDYLNDSESIISFELRFSPHNDSFGLSSDIYDFDIEVKYEADTNDLLVAFLIFVLPVFMIFVWVLLHKWINKKFLANVPFHKIPLYLFRYIWFKRSSVAKTIGIIFVFSVSIYGTYYGVSYLL